jgi:hypothetical protein
MIIKTCVQSARGGSVSDFLVPSQKAEELERQWENGLL